MGGGAKLGEMLGEKVQHALDIHAKLAGTGAKLECEVLMTGAEWSEDAYRHLESEIGEHGCFTTYYHVAIPVTYTYVVENIECYEVEKEDGTTDEECVVESKEVAVTTFKVHIIESETCLL